jgi:hypothetical protein
VRLGIGCKPVSSLTDFSEATLKILESSKNGHRLKQSLGYWFEIFAVVPSSFVKCTVNFSLNVCALS